MRLEMHIKWWFKFSVVILWVWWKRVKWSSSQIKIHAFVILWNHLNKVRQLHKKCLKNEKEKNYLRWAKKDYLYEEIVSAWNAFHDVPFDFIIFQDGQSIVDQNWWMCCFKVGAKIWRRFLHVNCCDLCCSWKFPKVIYIIAWVFVSWLKCVMMCSMKKCKLFSN